MFLRLKNSNVQIYKFRVFNVVYFWRNLRGLSDFYLHPNICINKSIIIKLLHFKTYENFKRNLVLNNPNRIKEKRQEQNISDFHHLPDTKKESVFVFR